MGNQAALTEEVEKLKHEALSKENEINQLRINLEELLRNQARNPEPSKKSQKQIDTLKNKINTLIKQLSQERTNFEAIQDEQDKTITQLRDELEKQKSFTERIMKHLGLAKATN